MELTREDAETIIAMDAVCTSEGIGPPAESLLRRIMEAFGSDIVPEWQRPGSAS